MAARNKTALFSRHQPGGMFSIEDQSVTTGARWFVHSVTGSDSAGCGRNPEVPTATIDYAINLATANKGDIIYVMPGHAETITAGGIDLDKAGTSVIGLGLGTNRPTITFSATTSDVDIDAANTKIAGMRFVSAINNLAWFIDANEGNFLMEDCDFITSSLLEAYNFINLATGKDEFTFRRCRFFQPTDPEGVDGNANMGCFYFVDTEGIYVEDCFFYGQFETSIFHNKTTAAKNVWIRNCKGIQLLSTAEIWTQVANMEGGANGNLFITTGADDVTEAKICGTVSDKFFCGIDNAFGNDGAGGQLALAGVADAT